MPASQQPRSSPKSRHKEHDPSQKARLVYFDQDEVALVRYVLGEDSVFQDKAWRIAESAADERQAEAVRQAESYAPYEKPPKRQAVAELLLVMAKELNTSRNPKLAAYYFANRDRVAVWEDDPSLDDVRARRIRRFRERRKSLVTGARALAWFGAGRCIGCGKSLADEYERGWSP